MDEDVAPAPVVFCATLAPLDDFDAPAPAATCAAPTPVSDDTAPAPAVTSTELLASKRESASGPDGLHYSMYRCAGCIGAKFLFAAYQSTVQAAALPPQGFGACRTVFIPESGEVNAQGLLIRSPGSLRPLTLCNCDCKILTAAMCSGLRRYSVECIHPSQRCVTQRIMTDNIFEIETAAIAKRTCYSEDPGILLTDFACAYSSVDHWWIFMVLERAGAPETLQSFPRGIYADSITHVEHFGAARGHFLR